MESGIPLAIGIWSPSSTVKVWRGIQNPTPSWTPFHGAICMILMVKPQTEWRQSNKSTDVVFILEDNSDRLETSLVFNFKTKSTLYDALS